MFTNKITGMFRTFKKNSSRMFTAGDSRHWRGWENFHFKPSPWLQKSWPMKAYATCCLAETVGTPIVNASYYDNNDGDAYYESSAQITLNANENWTISVWINPDNATPTSPGEWVIAGGAIANDFWAFGGFPDGTVGLRIKTTVGTVQTYEYKTNGRQFSDNEWRHFEFIHYAEPTFSGNNDLITVNGVADLGQVVGDLNVVSSVGATGGPTTVMGRRFQFESLVGQGDEITIIKHDGSATAGMLYTPSGPNPDIIDPRDLPEPARSSYGDIMFLARADDETATYGSSVGAYEGETPTALAVVGNVSIVDF